MARELKFVSTIKLNKNLIFLACKSFILIFFRNNLVKKIMINIFIAISCNFFILYFTIIFVYYIFTFNEIAILISKIYFLIYFKLYLSNLLDVYTFQKMHSNFFNIKF